MHRTSLLAALAAGFGLAMNACADDQKILKALIVDGQNNHDWKGTTPVLKQSLEETKRFKVDVATTQKDLAGFAPKFSDYDVVVSNYNGNEWPEQTNSAFAEYVAKGGGFVTVHAADN